MRRRDHHALADIDAVALELFFKQRRLDHVDRIDPQFVIDALCLHRRQVCRRHEDKAEPRG